MSDLPWDEIVYLVKLLAFRQKSKAWFRGWSVVPGFGFYGKMIHTFPHGKFPGAFSRYPK